MTVSSGLDPAFVVVTVSGLCIAAAIVIIGTQLLANARTANSHFASGTALYPPMHIAKPAGGGQSDDDASQQIFAQLNEYYAANISQGNTIFRASLLSMSIGFAIVFVGIVTARTPPSTSVGPLPVIDVDSGCRHEDCRESVRTIPRSPARQTRRSASTVVKPKAARR